MHQGASRENRIAVGIRAHRFADKLGGFETNKSNWQVIRVGFMDLFMYYLLKHSSLPLLIGTA